VKKVEPESIRPPAEGDALGRLFESARTDGLAPGQMDELWSRVGPAAAIGAADPSGGAGTASAGGASAATTGVGLGVKTLAALVVGGGLVAGGLFHTWRASQAPARPIVVVASAPQGIAPSVAPGPDPLAGPPADSPAARPLDVAALPVVASTPARSTSKPHAAAASGDGRAADRTLARQFPDEGPSAAGSPAPVALNAPPSAPGAPGEPGNGAQTASVQSTRATSAFAPAPSEGALLLRARQQLGSDPASTLALTDEHARRFPNGTLAPEREVLAIEALAALGRTSDARTRLSAFADRYPQSRHLARLETLVGR
jgi:hypothetical protein